MTLRNWLLHRTLHLEKKAGNYASRERYEDAARCRVQSLAIKDLVINLTATEILGSALDMPMDHLRELTARELRAEEPHD